MRRERTAQRLRQALAKYRQSKGFRRYPAAVRQEAARYARSRREQGAGPAMIASELGVAITTADSWSKPDSGEWSEGTLGAEGKDDEDRYPLVPVVVRPEPAARSAVLSRLEVDFGDGTRLQVTGISGEELARTIELLRRRP
jgi:transposase-like protein